MAVVLVAAGLATPAIAQIGPGSGRTAIDQSTLAAALAALPASTFDGISEVFGSVRGPERESSTSADPSIGDFERITVRLNDATTNYTLTYWLFASESAATILSEMALAPPEAKDADGRYHITTADWNVTVDDFDPPAFSVICARKSVSSSFPISQINCVYQPPGGSVVILHTRDGPELQDEEAVLLVMANLVLGVTRAIEVLGRVERQLDGTALRATEMVGAWELYVPMPQGGFARWVVEFRADGTYGFTDTLNGNRHTGTYTAADGRWSLTGSWTLGSGVRLDPTAAAYSDDGTYQLIDADNLALTGRHGGAVWRRVVVRQ